MQRYISHFDGIDGLKKEDVPVPSPRQGEVLVQVRTISLNYRDLEVINGKYDHHRAIRQVPNIVPCSDMCGVVQRVGKNVTKWAVGDRVVSLYVPDPKTGQLTERALATSLGLPQHGVLGTHRVFAEDALVKAPEHMSDEEACTLPITSVTAWMAINGTRPLGENGGRGDIAGLQIAKASGAKVIITSSCDKKRAMAKDLGADFGINYRRIPEWANKVMEVTDGHGADIILETGGSQTLSQSFACAAYGGLINCIGYTSGKTQASGEQKNVNLLTIRCNLTLKGFINGPTDRFEELINFGKKHEIHPVICKVFSFNQARDAFRYLESGSHFGKIVIRA
ncbi:GroES-like protein [Aspergillus eucalypticola CBS 122712]|uniref:GroES-like protein n=1 Tax=Aspergillus eucalypticola (strain CBS 122712 / IBT 29274) TaxID=1448314 RepID=A0A317VX08_ASPEC|nr:GroES-like protein [Aspergillus eucalypticola CBS 122712]PWY78926.1 GroES-like protein [Aspergillus eucalypticola CBS 122712]